MAALTTVGAETAIITGTSMTAAFCNTSTDRRLVGSTIPVQRTRSRAKAQPSLSRLDAINLDVRFTRESRHVQCKTACPLWANSGH